MDPLRPSYLISLSAINDPLVSDFGLEICGCKENSVLPFVGFIEQARSLRYLCFFDLLS